MRFSIFKTSILAVWISFLLSTLGAYLRVQSPLFRQWIGDIHRRFDDIPGAGLAFVSSWECHSVEYLFKALLITVGMVWMWGSAKRQSRLAQIFSLGIALILLLAGLDTFASIWWTDLSYGFYVLAVGKLLLIIGLLCSFDALQQIYRVSRTNDR